MHGWESLPMKNAKKLQVFSYSKNMPKAEFTLYTKLFCFSSEFDKTW